MITARIGDQDISIPTKWEDITLAQLVCLDANLRAARLDPILLLACLTSIDGTPGTAEDESSPYGIWFRCSIDQINRIIMPAIAFASESFDFTTLERPKSLKISGKEIEIPTDLAMESYGQLILLDNHVKKHGILASAAYAIAIYLQPRIDGAKFSAARAMALIPQTLQLPAVLAFPVADFFLSNSSAFTKSSTQNVRKLSA